MERYLQLDPLNVFDDALGIVLCAWNNTLPLISDRQHQRVVGETRQADAIQEAFVLQNGIVPEIPQQGGTLSTCSRGSPRSLPLDIEFCSSHILFKRKDVLHLGYKSYISFVYSLSGDRALLYNESTYEDIYMFSP